MTIPFNQLQKTFQRWNERRPYRDRNLQLISESRPLKADAPVRVEKFLARRGFNPQEQRELLRSGSVLPPPAQEDTATGRKLMRLERILGNNDLVGMPFLLRSLTVAKTVGRVWISNSNGALAGYGTGFLISPSLLITNHHVLPDAGTAKFSFVEFNYEMGENNALLPSEVFQLKPDAFYASDEDLDYAIVAVAKTSKNGKPLEAFGFNKLSRDEGKAIVSQWLNIIEHPDGQPKQIGLRENQLIDVLDNFLHYRTDTAPGASGSPVYNERWEVVGLHHSGVPATDAQNRTLALDGSVWTPAMGEDNVQWIANEGVRISCILKHMDGRSLLSEQARLYDEIFSAAPSSIPSNQLNAKMENSNPNFAQGTGADGSFSWTFPVTISARIGGQPLDSTVQNQSASTTPTFTSAALQTPNNEKDVLAQARESLLKRPDVLDVRWGYVFKNGWITRDRALVVTVAKRKTLDQLDKEGNSAVPSQFFGFPVEITGPTAEQLLRLHAGDKKTEALLIQRPDTLESRYFPPDDPESSLEEITDTMRVIAHVSPEEGWKNLSSFLENTKHTLTIAMYDFGAPHIVEKIDELAAKADFRRYLLTLQPGESVGEGTKADDLRDADTVRDFQRNFGHRFSMAWVHIGRVNGWVNSSYHIKVAVRDSKAFLLSSGNFQSSNQPDLSAMPNSTQNSLLKNYNREWHAVVEHEGLAKKYELYIKHDYTNNKTAAASELSVFEGVNFMLPAERPGDFESESNVEAFPPFDETREFTVTPLLTPDNFYREVLTVVQSAKQELYIQNQTFNAPKDSQSELSEIIDAVLQKQEEGVDVKVIFRVISPADARANIENLVGRGFDPASIKIHPKCHTKGVIVDGETVVMGSQNWSQDGITVNRDASLLFRDKGLASYFRKIFLHDWTKLAKQRIGRENANLELAPPGRAVPLGMRLVTWKEINEYL